MFEEVRVEQRGRPDGIRGSERAGRFSESVAKGCFRRCSAEDSANSSFEVLKRRVTQSRTQFPRDDRNHRLLKTCHASDDDDSPWRRVVGRPATPCARAVLDSEVGAHARQRGADRPALRESLGGVQNA